MKANLGIFWEGGFDFQLPHASNFREAAYAFKKDIVSITWNSLFVFEQNPIALYQAENILKGASLTGIHDEEWLQIKRFGDAAKELFSVVFSNSFAISKKVMLHLHGFVGCHDLQNGLAPDKAETAEGAFRFLNEHMVCPLERAFALFLFILRAKLFQKANKQTALLMMNGALMQAGFFPVAIQNHETRGFNEKLDAFYETGNATGLMHFFEELVKRLYPVKKTIIRESGRPQRSRRSWNR